MKILAKDFVEMYMVPNAPPELFPAERKLTGGSWAKKKNPKVCTDLIIVDGSFGFALKVSLPGSAPKCVKIRAEDDAHFDARMTKICELLEPRTIRHSLSLTQLDHLKLADLKQGGNATFQSACLFMDWVEGSTIKDLVEDSGTASSLDALTLCKSIAEFISDLDAASVSHRDFAADNIMVNDNGASLMVVDYDDMFLPALNSLPAIGQGKSGYLHPAAKGRAVYGPRADHFSALVIMLQISMVAARETSVIRLVNGLPKDAAERERFLIAAANSKNKLVKGLAKAVREASSLPVAPILEETLQKAGLDELLAKPATPKGPYRVHITQYMNGSNVGGAILPEQGKGMGRWGGGICPVTLRVGEVNGVEVDVDQAYNGIIQGPDGTVLTGQNQRISFKGTWAFEYETPKHAKCRVEIKGC